MKQAAKLILTDKDNTYLMLYRSNHPSFPGDPDLPGGTLEEGEEPIPALLREVFEETGITIGEESVEKLCESSAYDTGYTYYLYKAECESKPDVSISWEHSGYEWLAPDGFIAKARTAVDKYMHMVHDYLAQNDSGTAN